MHKGQQFPHKTPAEMLDWLRTNVRRTDDDCLIWAGSRTYQGFPKLVWRGKPYLAKRLLAELLNRKPRGQQCAYSSCGVRDCVAEVHLRVSSRQHAIAAFQQDGDRRGLHRSAAVALVVSELKGARA